MKLLVAALAAIAGLAFAGAASAAGAGCGSYSSQTTAEAPIVLPEGSAGS